MPARRSTRLRWLDPERCFAQCTACFTGGEVCRLDAHSFMGHPAARRFRTLTTTIACGVEVPVAGSAHSRLLGLARLNREDAGPGLLLPRCHSVHTFGMRFPLDLFFLDRDGKVLEVHRSVGRRRVVAVRGADSVLELSPGGELTATGP